MAEKTAPDARIAPRVLLCNCAGTFRPDAAAIGRGTGAECSRVHDLLCRAEAGAAAAALQAGGEVVIACGQQAAEFRDLADELGAADRLTCVDIRDRAGWSEDARSGPKMAALIAEARLPSPPVPALDVSSSGVCLVYGPAETALPAAARLSGALSVTLMLTEPEDVTVPAGAEMEIVSGRIRNATGALGRFAVEVDRFAERLPAGRARAFSAPRDGGRSECDIIVDLSGGRPLFPAHHKRDGYLRADPGDPLAIERALFDAAQMVGTFEKPLHIRFEASLCAHSRAKQVGCTRCLDVCPTSAIAPAGDTVAIDPYVCAGCGACAAVCPTGAASSDDPPVQHLFRRMRVMAEAYASRRRQGPAPPRPRRARRRDDPPRRPLRPRPAGRRDPARDPRARRLRPCRDARRPRPRLQRRRDPAGAPHRARDHRPRDGPGARHRRPVRRRPRASRLTLADVDDPDALSDLLYADRPAPLAVEPILPIGGRRDITRLAATALHGGRAPAEPLALPEGAPYGAILIDTQACTLCLACVGLCPPGALGDNPDRPEVNFRESACVQCGMCATVCPENAITLVPRLDLSPAALAPRELNSEEPFCCIECGKPFGSKKTIDRITAKLSGIHSMFTNSDNVRLIQMCDDCRVRAQFKPGANNPFAMGERPRVRTTDDYIKDREKN